MSNYPLSCEREDTDYGRPLKPFSIENQNFVAWADNLDI